MLARALNLSSSTFFSSINMDSENSSGIKLFYLATLRDGTNTSKGRIASWP